MIWLTRQALKRSSITILIALAVLIFGIVSTGSVKQELFPDISFPIVSVTTAYPGASAEVVDQEITQPIERALASVPGVESLQSTSSESFAFTILQFDVNADPRESKALVQEQLSALTLPDDIQEPQVGTFDFTALPVVVASISGDDLAAIQERVERDVVPALAAIPGVSNVRLTGGEAEQVLITLDPEKLAANNITQQQVVQFLQANNLAFPVGTVDDQGRSLPLRVSHQYSSTAELERVVVGIKGVNLAAGGLATQGGFGTASGLGLPQTPATTPTAAPTTQPAEASLIPAPLQSAGITQPDQITPEVIARLPEQALAQFPLPLALALPADSQTALARRLPPPQIDPALRAAGITRADQITPQLIAAADSDQIAQIPVSLALALSPQSRAAQAQRLADTSAPAPTPAATLPQEFAAFGITSPEQITPELIAQISDAALSIFTPELIAQLPQASQGALAQRRESGEASGSGVPDALLIRLADVGTVERGTVGGSTITRVNGQPALGLEISKDQQANTVAVVDAVREELARVERDGGTPALRVSIVTEQGSIIEESIRGVTNAGLIGAAVAVVVIFLFLVSLRTTIIAAVSIPLSIVVALILMRLQGYSLNVITLGGLAVAIGRVVDDSIVVLENIYRHIRRGDDLQASVLGGTREVAGAITASTLTTVCVFLPLGLAGGLVSKIFLPFALTVTYALLASLLVALTIVPLLARIFLRGLAIGEERESWLQRVYTPLLTWSLRHRALTLLIAFLLFGGSVALAGQLTATFLPDSPEKNITISITTPSGSDLETTGDRAAAVEQIAARRQQAGQIGDIQTVIGQSGSGDLNALAGGTGTPNQASLTLILTDQVTDPEALADELEQEIAALSGIEVATVQTVPATSMGGGGSSGLDLLLISDDPAQLRDANARVMERLGGDAGRDLGIANVTSNLAEVKPALQVTVDPEKAIAHGTSTAQVALQIRSLLTGERAGSVTLEGETAPLDLFVQVDPATVNVEKLRQLQVGTVNPVPLEEIATVQEIPGASSITRIDGDRAAAIRGQITRPDTINVQTSVEQAVEALGLPAGVEVRAGAQAQSQTKTLNGLGLALLIAIVLVYIVMVFSFGSLLDPFVILFSLPLAVIGAVLGLYLADKPIGITSLIGMLMLIGIVVTNAIVLLELVEQYRHERGMPVYDALVRAGRVRLRPILMTAIATIVALIPLAIGLEKGSFLTADLAIVVIGGLLTSTLLTLLVVPVIYSLVNGLRDRFGGNAAPRNERATEAMVTADAVSINVAHAADQAGYATASEER